MTGGTPRARTAAARALRWGRPLAGAAVLALLGWRLGSGPFLTGLRQVDARAVTLALAIGAVTTVLSAWRWSLVARGLGLDLPLRTAVGSYYRSLFLNAVLPGGVLGDVHRAVRHGRDSGDVSRGVSAVVLERTAGQLVLFAAGAAVLMADPALPLPRLAPGPWATATMTAVAAAAAVTVLAMVARARRAGARSGAAQGPAARPGRRWTADVRSGLLAPGQRLRILTASMVILAGHVSTFGIAARAAGASAPFTQLLPLMLLALLAMTLPVSFGGWGPREAVSAWAFGAAGLSAAQGLTVAVVYGLLALVASLPGAAVVLASQLAMRRGQRDQQELAERPPAQDARAAAPRPAPSRVPVPALSPLSPLLRRVPAPAPPATPVTPLTVFAGVPVAAPAGYRGAAAGPSAWLPGNRPESP